MQGIEWLMERFRVRKNKLLPWSKRNISLTHAWYYVCQQIPPFIEDHQSQLTFADYLKFWLKSTDYRSKVLCWCSSQRAAKEGISLHRTIIRYIILLYSFSLEIKRKCENETNFVFLQRSLWCQETFWLSSNSNIIKWDPYKSGRQRLYPILTGGSREGQAVSGLWQTRSNVVKISADLAFKVCLSTAIFLSLGKPEGHEVCCAEPGYWEIGTLMKRPNDLILADWTHTSQGFFIINSPSSIQWIVSEWSKNDKKEDDPPRQMVEKSQFLAVFIVTECQMPPAFFVLRTHG